ncbi:unnamed protein product [Tilletia laevis]|nr:hypothetical protein CF328_g179 [Tilletia controversa]CAD6901883.1 unnamed protein product [Tilletia controversa]CAD6902393.1 unnamed protein product [Tilletia laevis]CAD6960722.1 unnamed protein product [Tilletia caries]CAD6971926.1 unnamed protein product [Tilletia controversa]
MSAKAGPSNDRMKEEEGSMVTGRAKRSTAGNWMRALLKSGLEPEELFEEVVDDVDFEAAQAEPDIIDSDFDKSSDEEIHEDVAEKELEALEKANKKAERQKKLPPALRLARAQKSNIGAAESAPNGVRKRKSKTRAIDPPEENNDDQKEGQAEPLRASNRKSTLARTQEVINKLKEKEERAAKRARVHPSKTRPKLTQDALIAEALETEEMNRESLKQYFEQEEERKARSRGPKRTVVEGPFVRWTSIAIKDGSAGATGSACPTDRSQLVEVLESPQAPMSARATTAADATVTNNPAIAARAEAIRARTQPGPTTTNAISAPTTSYSRSLVSLHDLDEDAEWYDRQAALFGDHCEWDVHEIVISRNRRAHPRQSICPITGLPALYRDGRTGVPFATADAQHVLSDLLDNEYVWTGSLGEALLNVGCWLGREDEEGAASILTRARQLAGDPLS